MIKNFEDMQVGDRLFFYNLNEKHFYASPIMAVKSYSGGTKVHTEHHVFIASGFINTTVIDDSRENSIVVFTSLNKASDYLNNEREYHIDAIKAVESVISDIESIEI